MKYLLGSLLLLFLFSCERAIDPNLENQTPKLVVDAQIENGQPPVVVLTKSISYFNTIDSSGLTNIFVRNAVVTISDGIRTHQLKGYDTIVKNGTIHYYGLDPALPLTAIIGAFNKTYTLTIQAEGNTYTSTTTIPALAKKLDSMWWKPAPMPQYGWEVILMVKATDPPGYGNYIRYFTKRNSEPFFPGLYSVYDDQFVDGKTYELQVDAGQDKNIPRDDSARTVFFARGDTVTMKFCNIDKPTYDFWRTWEYAYAAIGNPFSSPIKVLGNISNGALGNFSGYAVQYKTLIIPH
jgi:hypothetical protein